MHLRNNVLWSALAAAILSLPTLSHGQAKPAAAWPVKPVLLIIPLSSGGPGDREFRPYMDKMQASLGQPFVLDFKPGGNTIVGNQFVIKSKPDGYTYLVSASGLAILPALTPDLPYDTVKAFTPVSLVTKRAMMLMVRASLPVNTYQEYIAYARNNPGKLNWGTAARGGVTHLVGAWLHQATNTEVTFIHYKGSAPYVIDLIAQRIDVAPISLGTGAPQIKAGKFKALALLSGNRIAAMPELRTVAEMGVPDYEYPSWLGVLGPAGTPPAIASKFSEELAKAVKAPDLQAALERDAITPIGSTPAEFAKVIATEVVRWKKLVAELKIEAGDQ
jgi:tripartite-type tricarboxylate transporter receptor subunit TctC